MLGYNDDLTGTSTPTAFPLSTQNFIQTKYEYSFDGAGLKKTLESGPVVGLIILRLLLLH